jgi:hypothetical protein
MNDMRHSSGFVFHHMAMAVGDVETSTRAMGVLGFSLDPTMPDAVEEQYGVRLRFLMAAAPQLMLELVAPIRGDSVISDLIVKRGAGLYHSCFEVLSLTLAIEQLERNGFRKVGHALRATAFGSRPIQFMHSPAAGLVELLEAAPQSRGLQQ